MQPVKKRLGENSARFGTAEVCDQKCQCSNEKGDLACKWGCQERGCEGGRHAAGERGRPLEVHAGVSSTLYGWLKPNSGLATACLRPQTNIRSS